MKDYNRLDEQAGSGRLAEWVGAFFSLSHHEFATVRWWVDGDRWNGQAIQWAPGGLGIDKVWAFVSGTEPTGEDLSSLRQSSQALTMDSDAAMQALLAANGTLREEFAGQNGLGVEYVLALADSSWHLYGSTKGGILFQGTVDFRTGQVTSLVLAARPPGDGPWDPGIRSLRAIPLPKAVQEQLPKPMHLNGTVLAGTDPTGLLGFRPCMAGDACISFPLTFARAFEMRGNLTWQKTGSAFDFFVWNEDGEYLLRGGPRQGNAKTGEGVVDGNARLDIVADLAADDSWEFMATFDWPE
ncbi:MAG: hypothetical protein ABR562_03075 [Thermoplasmatota archaeon]